MICINLYVNMWFYYNDAYHYPKSNSVFDRFIISLKKDMACNNYVVKRVPNSFNVVHL